MYFTIANPSACQILTSNIDKKWQQLITIDKDTPIGTSYLNKVEYNAANSQTLSGTKLDSFLYTQNVIDFTQFSNNRVKFELTGIPKNHYKVMARMFVYTECTTQNKRVTVKLNSNTQNYDITTVNSAGLFETTAIEHTQSTLSIEVIFGIQG